MKKEFTSEHIDFAKLNGLVPAVVQHAENGVVLMVGFMNRDALAQTLRDCRLTFWSRSKQRLWQKGETSGHVLSLVSITADCDNDSLLIQALPSGPVCHTGADSCFEVDEPRVGIILARLESIIASRKKQMPEGSYTADLFRKGPARVAQKVGEEGLEVALAAVQNNNAHIIEESADLLFHLFVLLQQHEIRVADVEEALKRRMK